MKKKTSETMVLARLFASFIDNVQGKRSPHTIQGYKEAMRQLATFAEVKKHCSENDFGLEFFKQENIYEFVKWLKDRGVSESTCNMRIGQISAFTKYLRKDPAYRKYHVEMSEVMRAKLPKHPSEVLPLTRSAVKALINAPGLSNSTGLRYTTMMSLLYSTATRIDEVLSIRIKDLRMDISKPNVTVLGKGHKARTVYIVKKTYRLLRKYILQEHGTDPNPESYLFYSRTKGLFEKSSARGVNKQLRSYAQVARMKEPEVPETVHSHQFRHSMATHCLEDGLNVFQISKMLGHQNVQTTMTYLGFTINMLDQTLKKVESTTANSITPNWKSHPKLKDLF